MVESVLCSRLASECANAGRWPRDAVSLALAMRIGQCKATVTIGNGEQAVKLNLTDILWRELHSARERAEILATWSRGT